MKPHPLLLAPAANLLLQAGKRLGLALGLIWATTSAYAAVTTIPGRVIDSLWWAPPPPDLCNVVAIAANAVDQHVDFSVALRSDGTVVAWGGLPAVNDVPLDLTNVIAISAGGTHVLALKSNGQVCAWGYDWYHRGVTNVPAGLTDVVAISAGKWRNLALKNDGTLVAWGLAPTNVPTGLTNLVKIAAGYPYNLGLQSDGSVAAWFWDGSVTNLALGLTNIMAIAAGDASCLALRSNGTVLAWTTPRFPGGRAGILTNVPASLSNVVAVAAAAFYQAAVKSDGTLVEWTTRDGNAFPILAGVTNAVAVAAGLDYDVVITVDPRTAQIQRIGNDLAVRFHTFSGQRYSVKSSPDLMAESWTVLPGGDVEGNGLDVVVTDTNAIASASQRFYRVVVQ